MTKMKVLITGATGLVGKAIVKQCHEQGIVVHYLTTSKQKLQDETNYKGFYWNLNTEEIDIACFENVDVIISLAGTTIAKRWTRSYKKAIINSRVKGLQLLKSSIVKNDFKIKKLVSASAIGIYPNSLSENYSEDHPKQSHSFLGTVVKQWEDTIDSFLELKIKVAKVRIGLVLDSKEGAFPKIINPIKFGMGAAFGDGKQWQSWIHVSDLASLFMHILSHDLEGIYNGVAPNPITNIEMTRSIAKHLKKPLLLPNIPKFMMKLMLGEMHILLFESQCVSSKKIEQSGFEFKYNTLNTILSHFIVNTH